MGSQRPVRVAGILTRKQGSEQEKLGTGQGLQKESVTQNEDWVIKNKQMRSRHYQKQK